MGVNLAVTKGIVFGLSAGDVRAARLRSRPSAPAPSRPTSQLLTVARRHHVPHRHGGRWRRLAVGSHHRRRRVSCSSPTRTGDWTEPDEDPRRAPPVLQLVEDRLPAAASSPSLLIVLMFVAPLGIVGLWRQSVARFVRGRAHARRVRRTLGDRGHCGLPRPDQHYTPRGSTNDATQDRHGCWQH